ncbi:hypothetical protein N7456_002664 [Penicillium angulare]|uniref:Fe2OG dioxygenase domain-containing protein n=1 Tax=Penicillium angulare TaxID=116970 RepID=A0A9W9G8I5_9EURO|nr:hypothetical protein N7456_002664 [Penicillium angulare]
MPKRKHPEPSTDAGPSEPTPSIPKLSTDESLRSLQESIVGAKASATFVCGGTIPIIEHPNPNPSDTESKSKSKSTLKASQAKSPPSHSPKTPSSRHIFWTKEDNTARRLNLPLSQTPESQPIDSSKERLKQLISDCEPATFGYKKEDILDPSYRNAGKLDPNRFACNFHPCEHGILENIEQILLPGLNNTEQNTLPFRKLSVELYKLNIYSGPNGVFRKHVDTPRCESQIGSLVICLPCQFEGGDLAVRHDGKEVVFNWEERSSDTIQWAAFYSDCEHEIKTITNGDRITLTYNLFVTEPIAACITQSLLDIKTLPLYGFLQDLLSKETFMAEGGTLGIWCSHSYPHTIERVNELLPRGLKGSDLALYAVLKALGIDTKILPAVLLEKYLERPEKWGELVGNKGEGEEDPEEEEEEEEPEEYYDHLNPKEEGGISEERPFDTFKPQWGEEWNRDELFIVHVGDALKGHTMDKKEMDENSKEKCVRLYGGNIAEDVTWIAGPRYRKAAHTYLAWGNESETDILYSYATIVAQVPPFKKHAKV